GSQRSIVKQSRIRSERAEPLISTTAAQPDLTRKPSAAVSGWKLTVASRRLRIQKPDVRFVTHSSLLHPLLQIIGRSKLFRLSQIVSREEQNHLIWVVDFAQKIFFL